MGAEVQVTADLGHGPVGFQAYAQFEWCLMHADLTAAAPSAAIRMRPSTYSDSNVSVIRVPPTANRILPRMRYGAGVLGFGTLPAVSFYGAYGPDSAFTASTGVFDDTGLIRWIRLDIASSGQEAGTPMVATPTILLGSGDMRDTNYKYGNITGEVSGTNSQVPVGWDLRGCRWVIALVSTPAVVNSGSGVVQLEATFINYVPMAYAPFS